MRQVGIRPFLSSDRGRKLFGGSDVPPFPRAKIMPVVPAGMLHGTVIRTGKPSLGEPLTFTIKLTEPLTGKTVEGNSFKLDVVSIRNGDSFREDLSELAKSQAPVALNVPQVEAHHFKAFDYSPERDVLDFVLTPEMIEGWTGHKPSPPTFF